MHCPSKPKVRVQFYVYNRPAIYKGEDMKKKNNRVKREKKNLDQPKPPYVGGLPHHPPRKLTTRPRTPTQCNAVRRAAAEGSTLMSFSLPTLQFTSAMVGNPPGRNEGGNACQSIIFACLAHLALIAASGASAGPLSTFSQGQACKIDDGCQKDEADEDGIDHGCELLCSLRRV